MRFTVYVRDILSCILPGLNRCSLAGGDQFSPKIILFIFRLEVNSESAGDMFLQNASNHQQVYKLHFTSLQEMLNFWAVDIYSTFSKKADEDYFNIIAMN